MEYTTLFSYPDNNFDDLSIYSYDTNIGKYYGISIEGYVLYPSINDAIRYYNVLLSKLKEWLSQQHAETTEHVEAIYKSKDIEVSKWDGMDDICIYTYAPDFTNLYDTYWWLYDVIEQLKTIAN